MRIVRSCGPYCPCALSGGREHCVAPLYVPADGDYINLYPGKIWHIVVPKDWVDVLAGTADG